MPVVVSLPPVTMVNVNASADSAGDVAVGADPCRDQMRDRVVLRRDAAAR
jgi:hypothetical protein